MQVASARLVPLLDDLKATMNQANDTLSHVDSLVVENRQDIRTIVVELKGTMLNAQAAFMRAAKENTTDNNTDNIDQIFENIRVTTENMKVLTDSLKTNPAVLIRGNNVKDRKPGDK